MSGFYSNEEQMLKRMKQAMPLPDVALIERNPEVIKIFARAAKEVSSFWARGRRVGVAFVRQRMGL